jgi:hypothetical protein
MEKEGDDWRERIEVYGPECKDMEGLASQLAKFVAA